MGSNPAVPTGTDDPAGTPASGVDGRVDGTVDEPVDEPGSPPARPRGTLFPDGLGRVWTVPNLISFARLLGVPVFLWLVLGVRSGIGDVWAIAVLALSGFSDWADGVLARKLGQYSRLGELLDPSADRLYILATLVGLVGRGIVPWWLAALLVGRDVFLGLLLLVLRGYGVGPLPVNYLGKSATFALLYAFPFLLLGSHHGAPGAAGTAAGIAWPIAWAFTLWGVGLYLWAGVLYVVQVVRTVRAVRAARVARVAGTGPDRP